MLCRYPSFFFGTYCTTTLLVFFLSLPLMISCSKEGQDWGSPATTFKTYKRAIETDNLPLLWSCLSSNYRTATYGNEYTNLVEAWEKNPSRLKEEVRREIAEEQIINQHIGYLLFDTTTLRSPQASPFFYFIWEDRGWKLTTHLDSLFHQELERAIERGEFKLPSSN